MLESVVEARLKRLEQRGFKVLKLRTPGYNGTPDRLILWPKYAPRPPVIVEIKAPGKKPRSLQLYVAQDWKDRGCDVRDPCDTIEKVDALIAALIEETNWIG